MEYSSAKVLHDSGSVLNGKSTSTFIGREPLSEVTAGKKYRSWKFKSDQEVAQIANLVILENGIENKSQLWKLDSGMANCIRSRGIWTLITFCGETNGKKKPIEIEENVQTEQNAVAEGEVNEKRTDGTKDNVDSSWKIEEVILLGQSTIDELNLSSMDELKELDPELYGIIVQMKTENALVFKQEERAENAVVPRKLEGPNLEFLGSEQLRKANLEGRDITDEVMYRLICSECFRIGTGNPYMGGYRCTIPKLQSNINRKLSGSQHRLFKKCWGKMHSVEVLVYNQNRSAASLDFQVREIRETCLLNALIWAAKEQMKVSSEWCARFGQLFP